MINRMRERLYSLMRYCSARRIGPSSVDDKVLGEYWRYRTETTALATNNTARRFMARAWNACAATVEGWSLHRLTEPPIKKAEPAWEAFPEGLRSDLDEYYASLAKPHRSLNGKRIQPCSPGTIETRRAALIAMARMAFRLGVPIESLTSLAALLHPDVVERVIDAYWQKRMEMSRKPAPSTSVRQCCEWPARPAAWTKLDSTVSTRSEPLWNSIAERA
jgi:hypothetical protein